MANAVRAPTVLLARDRRLRQASKVHPMVCIEVDLHLRQCYRFILDVSVTSFLPPLEKADNKIILRFETNNELEARTGKIFKKLWINPLYFEEDF